MPYATPLPRRKKTAPVACSMGVYPISARVSPRLIRCYMPRAPRLNRARLATDAGCRVGGTVAAKLFWGCHSATVTGGPY